ncbi:hypothetical protein B9057_02610 [Aestuarium zhoushanense]|nr:hypothetical protein B9057_02610 [Aestuarium zhoushanense]
MIFVRVKMKSNFGIIALVLSVSGAPGWAELSYTPVLPQFGGTNGQALTYLQFEKQMQDAELARIAAEEAAIQRELDAIENQVTAADRLVTSITNVLNVRLSQIAVDSILERESGDIPLSADLSLQWVRVDGNLQLTIAEIGSDPVVITLPVF